MTLTPGEVLRGKEHLFKKRLSKHSIGAYMGLRRGIGVLFEAELAAESRKIFTEETARMPDSFTQ
jgi:hypothetical protein